MVHFCYPPMLPIFFVSKYLRCSFWSFCPWFLLWHAAVHLTGSVTAYAWDVPHRPYSRMQHHLSAVVPLQSLSYPNMQYRNARQVTGPASRQSNEPRSQNNIHSTQKSTVRCSSAAVGQISSMQYPSVNSPAG